MYDNRAFTGGVRFGGLSDRTEIKILICYILSNISQPMPSQQLCDILTGQELVNYFELQDALSHLIKQNLITETDGKYAITDEGRDISRQLEKTLPYSIRERAYKAVIESTEYALLKRQNVTSITPVKGGGYNLNCTISDKDFTLFSIDIHMPNEESAKFAKENFIKHGHDIFKCVLGITTQNPSVYKDILEKLSEESTEQ